MGQTTGAVQVVSAAAADQAEGIGAVNEMMVRMRNVATRNSVAAEELAATSQELSAQAESLHESVQFFRDAESEALAERVARRARPTPGGGVLALA
jgi:methyl-accepting chemotaxis protein